MFWLSLIICLSTVWQVSVLCTDHASKPIPMDLVYSCLEVHSNRRLHNDVPILLIHGLSSLKEIWKGIDEVLALETGRKVCIVDLRNHGDSPWSDEVDTATMAEDIKHLLDELNVPKAVLLGHSLGGKISAHIALNYPQRIEKVIIEDMRPNGINPESLKDLLLSINLLKDVDKLVPQGVSEKEAKKIFLKDFNDYLAKSNTSLVYDDPDMFPIKCADGKCRWSTNTLIFRKIIEDIDSVLPESCGLFSGPALFIYGAESKFKVGDDENNIKKLFPNAKLVGVKGAGHVVHTFPEFMTEVVKFINEK